jgi:hypothetical protein
MADDPKFREEDVRRERICANCESRYSIERYLQTSSHYFDRPYRYSEGCVTKCLTCWLGCGPEHTELESNLLREVGSLDAETHLVVMPIARAIVESPLSFPNHTNIYPPGVADIATLNVLSYEELPQSLAAFQSEVAGMDRGTINENPTVAFPCSFDWDALCSANRKNQMEFIRFCSEKVDINSLNLPRYRLCSIELTDSLPGRAGQINSDHMMAGALQYNASRGEGRIIAGDPFSYIFTRGLGLPIEAVECDDFPGDGEVGQLAQHGLGLYSAILATDNPTAKFSLAIALLEFLAEPGVYTKFQDVKKIIARYVAKNFREYEDLLERFSELTGKTGPVTGAVTGYRTQVMHLGHRLDRLIPTFERRAELFRELDSYIRAVLDHMITHSRLSYHDYLQIRDQMRPFEQQKDRP